MLLASLNSYIDTMGELTCQGRLRPAIDGQGSSLKESTKEDAFVISHKLNRSPWLSGKRPRDPEFRDELIGLESSGWLVVRYSIYCLNIDQLAVGGVQPVPDHWNWCRHRVKVAV